MPGLDILRLVFVAALWGSSFLFMKGVAPVIGALPTAFFRVLLGAVGLAAFLAITRGAMRFGERWPRILLLGFIGAAIPLTMYSFAVGWMPTGYMAILNSTTPLITIIIGVAVYGDPVTWRQKLGVVLGMAGVAVVVRAGPVAVDAMLILGVLACLTATTGYAIAGFMTRRLIREGMPSRQVALGSQVGATVTMFPLALWLLSAQTLRNGIAPLLDPGMWASLAMLGFGCSALAYIVHYRVIERIGPLRAQTATFLVPPFGVLWGTLFLDEQFSWAHLAGGGLVVAAMFLVLGRSAPAAPGPRPEGPRPGDPHPGSLPPAGDGKADWLADPRSAAGRP